MTQPSPVRVRFAPSPTGRFHIGGARTALYDYLIARQTGGQFILRIEDTDRKRFVPGAEAELMDGLRWLGLDWDEGPNLGGPAGPYRQSERTQIYQDHAEQLVASGHAYPCFCTPQRLAEVRKLQQQRREPPRYDGLCRRLDPAEAAQRRADGESAVIRFKTPREGETVSVDLLRGEIRVENASLDDYILLKSDGLPVYHLAAMVDDHLMDITHVLRGSEWLPTFPLHVLIYQALGWEQPIWVHLSVFLNPSGKGKLSKRHAQGKDKGAGGVYVTDLQAQGYLPEAINNWTALMGWSLDDHTEFFPMSDLMESFSLERLNPSPAAVNFSKLDHFNGLHIRGLPLEALVARIKPYFEAAKLELPIGEDLLLRIAPLIQERIRTLDEAVEMAGFFFSSTVDPDPNELVGKKMTPAESAQAVRRAVQAIEAVESFSSAALEQGLRELAEELDLTAGQLFGILRAAITGQRVSPPLMESMEILGRSLVLERLRQADQALQKVAAAE